MPTYIYVFSLAEKVTEWTHSYLLSLESYHSSVESFSNFNHYFMTAQTREKLIYNGEEYRLATEPLQPYLDKNKIKFVAPSTACWRGYYGSWLIENGKLYLTDLTAYAQIQTNERSIFDGVEVGLEYLFPNQNKVFAEWFTGTLRIPHGEMIRYVHSGYKSIYEKELLLKIESGILISSHKIDNTHLIYSERLRRIMKCLAYLQTAPQAMTALNETFWRNVSKYSSSLDSEISIFNRIPKKLFTADEFLSKVDAWKVFKKEWYKELSSNYPESWIPLADFQTENDELFVDVSTNRLPVIVAKYMGRNDFRHEEVCDSLPNLINRISSGIEASETDITQPYSNENTLHKRKFEDCHKYMTDYTDEKQNKNWFRKFIDKFRKSH